MRHYFIFQRELLFIKFEHIFVLKKPGELSKVYWKFWSFHSRKFCAWEVNKLTEYLILFKTRFLWSEVLSQTGRMRWTDRQTEGDVSESTRNEHRWTKNCIPDLNALSYDTELCRIQMARSSCNLYLSKVLQVNCQILVVLCPFLSEICTFESNSRDRPELENKFTRNCTDDPVLYIISFRIQRNLE